VKLVFKMAIFLVVLFAGISQYKASPAPLLTQGNESSTYSDNLFGVKNAINIQALQADARYGSIDCGACGL
jgi:hypothetical protein